VQARVVSDVEAAEIAEAERAKGPVEPFLDRRVDVFKAGDTSVEEPVSLLSRGMEDAVDDEAVDLLVDEDWRTAHLASRAHRALHRSL